MSTWQVILLGLIEGLTEFIPVSSTGHLLLAGHFLGFDSPGKTFEVLIQLGAILAILSVYCRQADAARWSACRSDPRARRFVLGVLLAFLPAAVIGAVAHDFIKTVLFETPDADLRHADRRRHRAARGRPDAACSRATTTRWTIPLALAFKIGLCQCLAMIPGVSRSGATIVGAMLLGADKRSAAEFSFFLAMPTMAGAFAYDLYKNYVDPGTASDVASIALGFVVAFVAGVFVVRYLLDYVSRHGFALFALVAHHRRRHAAGRACRARADARAAQAACERRPAAVSTE